MAVTLSGSPFGSLSLASTSIVTGVSSGVLAMSFTAWGGWLGAAETTTVTVAVSVVPLEVTVYWKLSVPMNPAVGV